MSTDKLVINKRSQKLHKCFLWVAGGILFHGVFLVMFTGGGVNFLVLRYFTLLSNVLLGLGFICKAVAPGQFTKYVQFSGFVAILITCLVYNLMLVPLAGADPVTSDYGNFVTHLLAGVLALVNYLLFEEKQGIGLGHIGVAVAFPIGYWLVFAPGWTYFAPYFFMDPATIGWGMTLLWFGVLVLVFFAMALGLMWLDQRKGHHALTS